MGDNGEAMVDGDKSAGEKKRGGGSLVQAETMIQLGLAVPAGCFAGLLIGSWLDRHFHAHWMGITGLFLGAAGGFIHIFASLARMTKRGGQ